MNPKFFGLLPIQLDELDDPNNNIFVGILV